MNDKEINITSTLYGVDSSFLLCCRASANEVAIRTLKIIYLTVVTLPLCSSVGLYRDTPTCIFREPSAIATQCEIKVMRICALE